MMDLVTELHRTGTAIVMITHTPWLVAEYAQRAVLMRKESKLFDGPVREIFESENCSRARRFAARGDALGHRFGVTALTVDELRTGRARR